MSAKRIFRLLHSKGQNELTCVLWVARARYTLHEASMSESQIYGLIALAKIKTMAASGESTKKPSPKSVIELLCLKVSEEKTTVEKDGVVKHTTTLVSKCPNINCNKPRKEITFAAKLGHTNGLSHLKSCVAGGNDIKILHTKKNTIGNHFKRLMGVSEKEEELVKWFFLIVDES